MQIIMDCLLLERCTRSRSNAIHNNLVVDLLKQICARAQVHEHRMPRNPNRETVIRLLSHVNLIHMLNEASKLYKHAKETECAICLEDILTTATVLRCKHVFCQACWNRWRHTCPLCRTIIHRLESIDVELQMCHIFCALQKSVNQWYQR